QRGTVLDVLPPVEWPVDQLVQTRRVVVVEEPRRRLHLRGGVVAVGEVHSVAGAMMARVAGPQRRRDRHTGEVLVHQAADRPDDTAAREVAELAADAGDTAHSGRSIYRIHAVG